MLSTSHSLCCAGQVGNAVTVPPSGNTRNQWRNIKTHSRIHWRMIPRDTLECRDGGREGRDVFSLFSFIFLVIITYSIVNHIFTNS